MALLGAFLLGCVGQVEKPVDLSITEKDPARCDQAWLVFSKYRADVLRRNPGITVEVLGGDAARIFISSFNATLPVSAFQGDTVALFKLPGVNSILVSIISNGCVKLSASYMPAAVILWSSGVVPALPSSFRGPNSEGPKPPSI